MANDETDKDQRNPQLEPNESVDLTSRDRRDIGTWDVADPSPYMTFTFNSRRVRYFVRWSDGSDIEDVELTPQAYRDVVSTLRLRLDERIMQITDHINLNQVGDWLERVTEDS